MQRYQECIATAKRLQRDALFVQSTQDRNRARSFKVGLTVLRRKAAELKQELSAHERDAHSREWTE